MPTPTKYTYSLATDFGGSINTATLVDEIHANSTIVIDLDNNRIDTNGDVVDIWFKDALPAAEKTELDGDASPPGTNSVLDLHTSTATIDPPEKMEISVVSGGPKLIVDGVSIALTQGKWGRADLTLVESLHLMAVHLRWKNCLDGDYGWLALIHPGGTGSPTATIAVAATTFTITGKGAYYTPAGGALCVEFWDANDDLIEMALIASVAGDVVTLTAGVVNEHLATGTIRACYGQHTSMRGTSLIDGGLRLLGDGVEQIGSEHSMTDAIPAGLVLGGRFKTSSSPASREFAVNYKMRRPS